MPDIPIVNGPNQYVSGLRVSLPGATPTAASATLNISAGEARDSTNLNDIILEAASSPATVDITLSGVGGLDTGVGAINSLYAIYIIGDSTKFRETAGLLSRNHTAPILPFGYDMVRRIGVARTGGTVVFLPFNQSGTDQTRSYTLDDKISLVAAGTGTTPQTVDVSEFVPHINTSILLNIVFTANTVASRAKFNLFNEAINENYNFGTGAAATQYGVIEVPVSTISDVTRFLWELTDGGDAINIFLQGYNDHL